LLTGMGAPDVNLQECGGRTEMTLAWRDGPGMAQRMDAVLDAVAQDLSPARHRDRRENAMASRDARRHRRGPAAGAGCRNVLRQTRSAGPGGAMTFAELDDQSAAVAATLGRAGDGTRVGRRADGRPDGGRPWSVSGAF